MTTLSETWNAAAAALPPGWRLAGLRCTSTGLALDQRSDRWLAEACGPEGGCVMREHEAPEAALAALVQAFADSGAR